MHFFKEEESYKLKILNILYMADTDLFVLLNVIRMDKCDFVPVYETVIASIESYCYIWRRRLGHPKEKVLKYI